MSSLLVCLAMKIEDTDTNTPRFTCVRWMCECERAVLCVCVCGNQKVFFFPFKYDDDIAYKLSNIAAHDSHTPSASHTHTVYRLGTQFNIIDRYFMCNLNTTHTPSRAQTSIVGKKLNLCEQWMNSDDHEWRIWQRDGQEREGWGGDKKIWKGNSKNRGVRKHATPLSPTQACID